MGMIFLGGTAAKNPWRTEFIAKAVEAGIDKERLFNPVVPDWTPEFHAIEEKVKAEADVLLYYLADPMKEGNPLSAYSILEAAMGLYDKPGQTFVVFDWTGMSGHALIAMERSWEILKVRFPNGNIFTSMDEVIDKIRQLVAA